MYDIILFVIASAIMVLSGIAIFYQKSIMRAVVALTIAFTASSFIFFILGQNFIALLQLFIFVGGMSTYLIVAVSSEYKKINKIEFSAICAIALMIGLGFLLILTGVQFSTATTQVSMSTFFVDVFQSYYPIIFAAIIMLFLVAMGSVIVIRRFVKLSS